MLVKMGGLFVVDTIITYHTMPYIVCIFTAQLQDICSIQTCSYRITIYPFAVGGCGDMSSTLVCGAVVFIRAADYGIRRYIWSIHSGMHSPGHM